MILFTALALALVAVMSGEAHAQWGGAFLSENQFQQQKRDGGASSPFGGTPGGDPTNAGGREMPRTTAADEYKEKWMPTARAGFDVPEDIKKMMDAAKTAKPASRAEFRASSGTGGNMDPKTGTPQKPAQEPVDDDDDDDDIEEDDQDEYIPKSAPGRSDEGRRMDKCLRKVAPFCSLRVMNENFGNFVHCVVEMRYRVGDECLGWAEGHMPCAADISQHCDRRSPSDTTECLRASKARLSRGCVDSRFYVAMEEGFAEFRKGMEKGMEGQKRQQQQGSRHYNGPLGGDATEGAPQHPKANSAPPRNSPDDKQDGSGRKSTPSTVRIVPKKVVKGPHDEL
jgi:hypothetical protein